MSSFVSISLQDEHAMAITSDGRVYRKHGIGTFGETDWMLDSSLKDMNNRFKLAEKQRKAVQ